MIGTMTPAAHYHEAFLRQAIVLASEARRLGNHPFGALLVVDGDVVLTAMPGCLSYIVATDPAEPDALWITEVWDSADSHHASLSLPAVKATIAKARPLIAGFGSRVETVPIGGYGLAKTAAP